MGAWFIRNPEAPFQSGCSYETIVTLVSRGRIALDAVLRSPTTHQFWSPAKRVPGVANLLGICHSCGCEVEPAEPHCPECHAEFLFQLDRQDLGLMPLRALPGGPPVAEPAAPPPLPPAPHVDPSPSLLRHAAALESNVRWLWTWLFGALALIGLLTALAAASYFSGLVSINPDFAPKAATRTPESAEPVPLPPSLQPPPSQTTPSRPSPSQTTPPPPPMAERPPTTSEPTASPEPEPNATIREAQDLISQDSIESLRRAIALLEAFPAVGPQDQRDKAASLLSVAKDRLTQKELSGIR